MKPRKSHDLKKSIILAAPGGGMNLQYIYTDNEQLIRIIQTQPLGEGSTPPPGSSPPRSTSARLHLSQNKLNGQMEQASQAIYNAHAPPRLTPGTIKTLPATYYACHSPIFKIHRPHMLQWCARSGFGAWHLKQNLPGKVYSSSASGDMSASVSSSSPFSSLPVPKSSLLGTVPGSRVTHILSDKKMPIVRVHSAMKCTAKVKGLFSTAR